MQLLGRSVHGVPTYENLMILQHEGKGDTNIGYIVLGPVYMSERKHFSISTTTHSDC